MPSATFYNLPAEKRERLLRAAREEFSRVPYESASVNRIIRSAGIPRGSFYMYFTDKEELFGHLMDSYGALLERRMGELLEQREGDLLPPSWTCLTTFRPTGGTGNTARWRTYSAATGRCSPGSC